ncbi:hypothetical protein PV518_34845 [Streptomyces sp. ND04-05B]|uniref:hypothetical protein n=1 Tax=Streptomyces sp. ND04-05B TaxID=3028693 RepID=UPI0029A1EA06|nr:hypothetical protein [Streptomyces sp. ND04-05B]MDX3067292.1 hypothetical protein [Streptomyces sp. ND04-05B]
MSTLQEFATWHRGVDKVAVQRVLDGTLPVTELRPEEVEYAARYSKLSVRSVSKLLGIAERTVTNLRDGGEG